MIPAKNTEIKVFPAAEADLAEILRLAKSFDLDTEEMDRSQFVVAKSGTSIIGFGRLRVYTGSNPCTEVATVGVMPEHRNKGVGSAIVNELLRTGPAEIYVTCVISQFFSRFGFKPVKQYPAVLQKKVDFCKMFGFTDEQIFVMLFSR